MKYVISLILFWYNAFFFMELDCWKYNYANPRLSLIFNPFQFFAVNFNSNTRTKNLKTELESMDCTVLVVASDFYQGPLLMADFTTTTANGPNEAEIDKVDRNTPLGGEEYVNRSARTLPFEPVKLNLVLEIHDSD